MSSIPIQLRSDSLNVTNFEALSGDFSSALTVGGVPVSLSGHHSGGLSCADLTGCNLVYDTGHQVIYGDFGVTGYISGSSLHVGDCALTVTTGGRLGINTCEPLCDIDIRGYICHNSGNYINNSGYISGKTGIFDWVNATNQLTISGLNVATQDITNALSGNLAATGAYLTSEIAMVSGNVDTTSGDVHGILTTGLSTHSGIFSWLSGDSGYMRDEFTVGTGDCVFVVTTGGRIGVNTCDPQCDLEIYADTCLRSGNFTNYSGYLSGQSGIFDWLSGDSGYMRDEFTVGTGDCVFVVTTGGRIGVNTCDPQCDLEIYADTCLRSGNFTNYSGHSYFYNDVHISGGNLTITGNLEVTGSINAESLTSSGLPPILWTGVPPTETSYGLPGLAAYDNAHLYICTGINKWGRTNLNGWS